MALCLLHGKNPCKLTRYPDLMSIFAKERVHIRSLEFDRMILKYVKAGNIFLSQIRVFIPAKPSLSHKVPMTSAMQMPLSPCRVLIPPLQWKILFLTGAS